MDASAKQVVVMVARELTFTVAESTKIVQGDQAKKLADVKVGAKVTKVFRDSTIENLFPLQNEDRHRSS